MVTVLIIIGVVIALVVILKIKKSVKKHNAAMNAMVAKYMLEKASKVQRQSVNERIAFILQRDGMFTEDQARERISKMDPPKFYCFAALAMAELGIEPPGDIWRWQPVANPFFALFNAEKELEMARLGLSRKGIIVDLSTR